jgi:hypothetical protein
MIASVFTSSKDRVTRKCEKEFQNSGLKFLLISDFTNKALIQLILKTF